MFTSLLSLMTSHLQHRDSSFIICDYYYDDVYNINVYLIYGELDCAYFINFCNIWRQIFSCCFLQNDDTTHAESISLAYFPFFLGLKGDHMRSTIPCSTYDVVGSKQHSYSQMQAASPMTAFNSPYSNYGPGTGVKFLHAFDVRSHRFCRNLALSHNFSCLCILKLFDSYSRLP